jgi:mono/diheme cytochrome c family protein
VLQDVYRGLEPYVERGEIKRMMVVEEMPKPSVGHSTGFGFQRPVVSCGATYTPKRVWGFADVKPDGSAHFRVPAERAIYFLPLDEQGRAVQRMRTFTHLMPGEVQSCVGCHASRNGAAPHLYDSLALALSPPQELTPPDWGVRGFDYTSIVQPVLDKHCVSCHNASQPAAAVDLTGDLTEWFNVSYNVLAYENSTFSGLDQVPWRSGSRYISWISTMNGTETNILQIAPKTWGSPQSKLADLVLTGHPDEQGKPMVSLNADERQRILTWIDVNVPYYGTSTTTHQEWPGGRALKVPQLAATLKEVGTRRCAECHKDGPTPGRVRFTNVENNPFLLAPLAKSAGGTEQCGKAVFVDKNDPDYQKLLKLFEPITQVLEENPRQDMPGSHRPDCEVCEPPGHTPALL